MSRVQELVQELEMESQTTRRVLERVREDQLDWKPHEKSMSLGQLAMHVAIIPAALAELSLLPSFDVGSPISRPSAGSVAELLAAHDQSIATAKAILTAMDDASLSTTWRMMLGGKEIGAMPRAAFLRSVLFNHWYHHRGQLSVYLRQTGALVPEIYGASADEVPFGR